MTPCSLTPISPSKRCICKYSPSCSQVSTTDSSSCSSSNRSITHSRCIDAHLPSALCVMHCLTDWLTDCLFSDRCHRSAAHRHTHSLARSLLTGASQSRTDECLFLSLSVSLYLSLYRSLYRSLRVTADTHSRRATSSQF